MTGGPRISNLGITKNAHTPLFIWDPRSQIAAERRQSLVQMIDFPATLLDYFNVPLPTEMEGKSAGANNSKRHACA